MAESPFAVDDLVQLPRLSIDDTLALAAEVETVVRTLAAENLPLPEPIERSWRRVVRSREEVQALLQRRGLQAATSPPDRRQADQRVDRAWARFERFVRAWASLEDDGQTPSVTDIAHAYALLFPAAEGLRFLREEYPVEWAKSQQRLDLIASQGLRSLVVALGGARLLDSLQAAHDAYGRALGITRETAAPSGTDLRPTLQTLHNMMRELVLRVRAHADPEVPGSETFAERLLQPFVSWFMRSRRASPRAAALPGEGAENAS